MISSDVQCSSTGNDKSIEVIVAVTLVFER